MIRIPAISICLFAFLAWSCEKEFTPEPTGNAPDLVVEGYIEAGEQAAPPYVILTRDVPFFSSFSTEDLENTFVHNARVEVSDGEKTVPLKEVCLDDLTPQQKQLAGNLFGFKLDSIGFNFCVYTDLSFSMRGEAGKSYTLEALADNQRIVATTRIPAHVALDELWFRAPPGEPNDTLAQLLCTVSDPAGENNFYRYQVEFNNSGFISPLASVSDDRLFDGEVAEFPLLKPEPRGTDNFNLNTFGLYQMGDTITVKWMSLDEAHYNFWNTLEFSLANQGPFSSYTRIDSNVEGALGIWGGFSASYYTLEVER